MSGGGLSFSPAVMREAGAVAGQRKEERMDAGPSTSSYVRFVVVTLRRESAPPARYRSDHLDHLLWAAHGGSGAERAGL